MTFMLIFLLPNKTCMLFIDSAGFNQRHTKDPLSIYPVQMLKKTKQEQYVGNNFYAFSWISFVVLQRKYFFIFLSRRFNCECTQ